MNVIFNQKVFIESFKKNPIILAISIIWSDLKKDQPSLIVNDLNIIYEDCPVVGEPLEYHIFLKNGCENKLGET